MIHADERLRRPATPGPQRQGDETGPKRPDVERPQKPDELMRRLKQIDPDRAKKYRQRSGQ